jgi:hypothetical protein
LLTLAAGLVALPAGANGRFPAANQLVINPVDPQSLLLRTTFGLLSSQDGGAHFSWVCEKAVGYSGSQDPAIALTASGTVLVAAFEGLAQSLDGGCGFSFVGPTTNEFVIDVAIDRATPESAVAITSTGQGEGFFVQVFETPDNGNTWAKAGTPAPTDFLAETIETAPSRHDRLYLSGFTTEVVNGTQIRHGFVEVSDDRGQNWARYPVDLAGDKSIYLAAVDPGNADLVYLRSRGAENDRLLASKDGGKTWASIYTLQGSMLGFALSPDGARLAVGGPTAGLWVASRDDLTFAKHSDEQIACLTWAPEGLYACANGYQGSFSVGRSGDEGKSFTPLLRSFRELSGPRDCPASTGVTATCSSEWASLKSTIGVPDGSGSGGSGGAEQAGAAGTAGATGATGGAAGQAGASDGQPLSPQTDSISGGCHCALPGAPRGSQGGGWAALGVLLGVAAWGARRRR